MTVRNSISVNLAEPTGLKAIDKNIAFIGGSMEKINAFIHVTALAIMRHAEAHGDCTRALNLAEAMPASMRREMLIEWFRRFSPVVIKLGDGKQKAKVGMWKKDEPKYVAFDLEAADALPFWKIAEQEPESKTYTFDQLLEMAHRLGKTIDKKIKDGKVAAEDVPSAEGIVTALSGLKVARVVIEDGLPNVGKPANSNKRKATPVIGATVKAKTVKIVKSLGEVKELVGEPLVKAA